MSKLYFRYIAGQYFKSCLIFVISFVLFYVFVDFLINFKKLNLNSNLFLLYLGFGSVCAFYYVLPISQILAMIYTCVSMIKKSEFIAIYSLGISKNSCAMAIFLVSLIFSIFAIAFNFTSVAYAENYKNNILQFGYLGRDLNDLFFKYNNEFVYIGNYVNKTIYDIKIFHKEGNEIKSILKAKKAVYKDNNWVLEDAIKTTFKNSTSVDDFRIVDEKLENKLVLNNFNPSILDNFKSDEISLKNAFFYLKNFEANIQNIRANIYKQSIFLLFAPFLSLIFFYKLPIMPRSNDLSFLAIAYVSLSLLVYGILYLLLRFAQNGAINPELGVLVPIFFIILYSLMKFHKNK